MPEETPEQPYEGPLCEKCGKTFKGKPWIPKHGWPESTGRIIQEGDTDSSGEPVDPRHVGAVLWTFVNCATATPEQIAVYQAARKELQGRVVVKGFEGKGKEQLEQ